MSLVTRNPAGIPSDIPQPSMAWWDSETATIIKYSLLGVVLLILFAWVILGSMHARQRINRGESPLRYHRWLVPKSHRPVYWQENSLAYYRDSRVPMRRVDRDPPPDYSADMPPPTYQPPQKKEVDIGIPLPVYGEPHGESSTIVLPQQAHGENAV